MNLLYPSNAVSFLDYKEALEKLSKIENSLKEITEIHSQEYDFMPLLAFLRVITAQIEVLKKINKEYLNTPVAWDDRLNLPALPALVADSAKFCDFLETTNDPLRIILNSFKGWTVFAKEEIQCCCGERKFKTRKVEYEVLLNHTLSSEENFIQIKQFVGIRTNDKKHLKGHYSKEENKKFVKFYKESRVLPNINLVWLAVNRLNYDLEDGFTILTQGIESCREFYDPSDSNFVFGKKFMEIVKF